MKVYESVCDTLVALHEVDHKAVGLEDFGRDSGYVQRQTKTWGTMYTEAEKVMQDKSMWEGWNEGEGLEYSDGYREPMDRTLAYLEDHVEEAMQSFGGTEPVSIV